MVYFGHGTLVKLDFLPLGLRGDEQPAKLPVPSALAPRLATLATAVGFKKINVDSARFGPRASALIQK